MITFTRNIFLLTTIFVSFQTSAHKESTYFLHGTLGNRNIGVRIDDFAEVSYLKFFYLDAPENIILKGDCQGQDCYFSDATGDKKPSFKNIKIKLNHQENEDWKGVWQRGFKKIRINLKPIIIDSIEHRFNYISSITQMDPFSYLRTSRVEFNISETDSIGDIRITWLNEEYSGIKMFRIISGVDSSKLSSLNRFLTDLHLSQINQFYQCGSFQYSGSFHTRPTLLFINQDILSFKIESQSTCLSEYENEISDIYNINLNNMKNMNLEDLFYIGGDSAPVNNSADWFKYRRNIFAPYILKTLKEEYPDQFESTSNCNYNDTRAWSNPEWYLTFDGLYIGAKLPGINRSCNNPNWSIIPFEKINENFKIDSL